ncbi:MAG: tetratricopeptide repeat protein [Bacteroidaceae bacterium]|nr:tetratricopeptide repeat protein [Bacteroidaceae bacterium]
MKKIIYLSLLLAMPFLSTAQDVAVHTKQMGDEAYTAGKFADAIEIYESVIAEQGGSLPLYYNLGNAYYRSNQPGKAILNYERALRYDSNDEDTKANLNFVQSKIVDKIPQDDVPFYNVWANTVYSLLSKDSWAVVGIVSFTIMLAMLLLCFFNGNLRKPAIVIATICLAVAVLSNVSAYNLNNTGGEIPEGVILDEMVVVKSSPDSSGTELTKIHEGLKVTIIDDALADWIKIEANNGNRVVGWVRSKSIERI